MIKWKDLLKIYSYMPICQEIHKKLRYVNSLSIRVSRKFKISIEHARELIVCASTYDLHNEKELFEVITHLIIDEAFNHR